MAKIKIDKDKCKGCMLCLSACPQGLIVRSKKLNKRGIHCVEFRAKKRLVRRSKATLNFSLGEGGCTACTMCALICPDICIEVYK